MCAHPAAQTEGEHGWRLHSVLNFLGLVLGPVLGAVIGAIAGFYANPRQEQFQREKAQLEQEIDTLRHQNLKTASMSPAATITETALENQRLRDEINELRTKVEASGNRTAELEKELHTAKQQLDAERAEVTQPSETATMKMTPAGQPPSNPLARQRLERFIVEIPRAQASRDGTATLYVTFINTTSERLKMLLAGGFLNQGKTFLVDDTGQRYDAEEASGIGTCCFGFAGGDWQGNILELPPKGTAEVTLTFRRRGRWGEPVRESQSFTLTSELTVGDAVRVQGWSDLQWRGASSASIRVAGIQVR
jgi:hypothetical protein